jgi:hypothetical protein
VWTCDGSLRQFPKVGNPGCSAGDGHTKLRAALSRVSSGSHGAVIVAVPLIWMMKVSFHEIVFMTPVRNRFMSATSPMSVLGVMRAAGMARGTGGRIRAAFAQSMFIHVSSVSTVKMAVVQIIDVTFMLNRGVPAAWTMFMGMLIVGFVIAHFS